MDQLFSKKLHEFPRKLKSLCFFTVFNLTIGVIIGMYYVGYTTNFTPIGTSEHFSGSQEDRSFDIPEKYPKPISELLSTTHNHIISMTFIFVIIGGIFFFSTTIKGILKTILIIEPFLSIILTFGGIWLIRFINPLFSYLVIFSGILMYLSFFIMALIIFYELIIKR